MTDVVNHPPHYTAVPGVECIDVVEHFPFCRGNAIKYLWRAGAKGDLVEDLRKAIWYIEREIAAAEAASAEPPEQYVMTKPPPRNHACPLPAVVTEGQVWRCPTCEAPWQGSGRDWDALDYVYVGPVRAVRDEPQA